MYIRWLPYSLDEVLNFSSKSWLLDMPPELQSMIASNLDNVSLCNFKLVCKGIDTWTKEPPKLSTSEWQQFHSMFETRKRRTLKTLGCSYCMKILDKGLFSDGAAARILLNKGRVCISCAIQKGSKPYFKAAKVNGTTVFGCRGCLKAKPLVEEELKCLVDKAHWYEEFPAVDVGSLDASRGCRWCHDCWTAVKNYRSLDPSP